MNFDFDIVMILAIFTIGAVLVLGIISWMRAARAEKHHEGAAVADRQQREDADLPPEGTPGGITDTAGLDHSREGRMGGISAENDSGRSWDRDRGANPPTPMPPRN